MTGLGLLVETPSTPKLSLESHEIVVRPPFWNCRWQGRGRDVIRARTALGTAQIAGQVFHRDIYALEEAPAGEQVTVNDTLMAT